MDVERLLETMREGIPGHRLGAVNKSSDSGRLDLEFTLDGELSLLRFNVEVDLEDIHGPKVWDVLVEAATRQLNQEIAWRAGGHDGSSRNTRSVLESEDGKAADR